VTVDRFDRFLPLAGALIGLLFFVGLALTWGDSSSETAPAETFSYWQDNRGQHQISGLLLAPLVAFLLVFFGAGLQRRLRRDNADSGHGPVAFGGALLAATAFALVGMLEAAMTNAAHEGQRQAVYTLSQLHSYDWLAWNAAFAAMLLATGLGARRNGMLPTPVAWASIVVGASLLTPLGFFGFFLVPLWLTVVGLILSRSESQRGEQVA
jgi:ABC-type Fe3+-siderophore transport system permease subunit